MKINFLWAPGPINKCLMHSKSDNAETMTDFDTDEIIQELFKSLLHRYEMGLERSMKGSNFVCDGVNFSASVIR